MRRLFCSTAAIALALGFCVSAVTAQDSAAEKRAERRAANQSRSAAKLDTKTSAMTVRASQLIGMNIENAQGEGVGEINDLVLDSKTGRIRYAAVTYGGFLGVGNKMFAVPFEAFRVTQDPDDPDDPDDFVLVLNVTQQQLEGDTGFDEDHWPNFADRKYTRDLDTPYGVERKMRPNQRNRGDVDVDVNEDGVDVDVDRR